MSEAVSRAARRDMRRAVGEEAIAVIDAHSRGLEDVIVNLNALNARVDTLYRILHALMESKATDASI